MRGVCLLFLIKYTGVLESPHKRFHRNLCFTRLELDTVPATTATDLGGEGVADLVTFLVPTLP